MKAEIDRISIEQGFDERMVDPHPQKVEEAAASPSLRPECFADYPGQEIVKENLKVYVGAAKKRERL